METSGSRDESKQFCFFVLFDWRKAEILAIHNRYSDTLFKLYVNNTESFQNGSVLQNCYPTTMEHCQVLRQQQHENIIEALVASSKLFKNSNNFVFVRRFTRKCDSYSKSNFEHVAMLWNRNSIGNSIFGCSFV